MSWRWSRDAGTLTSTCVLCQLTVTGRRDNDVTFQQRSHTAWECQQRRAQTARVADVERCRNRHPRAGNTSIDGRGNIVCLACRRDVYAAQKVASESGGKCCAVTGLGVGMCDNGGAETNRPTRERRTVLSTPSTTRKEAVDS